GTLRYARLSLSCTAPRICTCQSESFAFRKPSSQWRTRLLRAVQGNGISQQLLQRWRPSGQDACQQPRTPRFYQPCLCRLLMDILPAYLESSIIQGDTFYYSFTATDGDSNPIDMASVSPTAQFRARNAKS